MKNTKSFALALLVALTAVGCSDNYTARNLGGTLTIDLPQNHKLINATWKESELWYLYRPMRADELAETSIFAEKSAYGLMEGKVIFKESK